MSGIVDKTVATATEAAALAQTKLAQHRGYLGALLTPQKISAARLTVKELWFGIPFALHTLYKMGKADKNHQAYNVHNTLASFVEAIASYGILTTVTGLFPVMALGWAAYQVGNAETKAQKVHAGLRSAVMFGLGALGIRAGQLYNDALVLRDAELIADKLKDLQSVVKGSHAAETLEAHLQPALKALESSVSPVIQHFDKAAHISKESMWAKASHWVNFSAKQEALEAGVEVAENLKTRISSFENAQQALLSALGHVQPEQMAKLSPKSQGTYKALHELVNVAKNAQGWKIMRVANPIIGYMGGLVVGCSVVKAIYNRFCIDKQQPGQPAHLPSLPNSCSSLYVKPILNVMSGQHGSSAHGGPYYSHLHQPTNYVSSGSGYGGYATHPVSRIH